MAHEQGQLLLVFGHRHSWRCSHSHCHLVSAGLEQSVCKATQRKHIGPDGNIFYPDVVRILWVFILCTTSQTILFRYRQYSVFHVFYPQLKFDKRYWNKHQVLENIVIKSTPKHLSFDLTDMQLFWQIAIKAVSLMDMTLLMSLSMSDLNTLRSFSAATSHSALTEHQCSRKTKGKLR